MRKVLVKQLISSSEELASKDLQASRYFMQYRSRYSSSMRDSCGDFGSFRQLEHAHYKQLAGSIIKSFQLPCHEVVQESDIESDTGDYATAR